MATRIVFLSGHETAGIGTEAEVVPGVRGDHPHPVRLEGGDGLVRDVNGGAHHVGRPGTLVGALASLDGQRR